MSLLQVYFKALKYLATYRLRVSLVVIANIVLAAITIIEPVLFGRIIDAISEKRDATQILILWGCFGVFNTVAYVLVARQADRLAHGRRADLLTESFAKIISMPLSWHHKRGTSKRAAHAASRGRKPSSASGSNSCARILQPPWH